MNWINRLWQWLKNDFTDTWIRHFAPWVSCVMVISGGLLTYNFDHLRAYYPNWTGLFNLIDAGLIWVFLLAAILTTITSWVSACRQKSIDALKAHIAEKEEAIQQIGNNIRFVFDGLLLNLSRKLGFPQNDQTRLSIYIHDSVRGCFLPCGRYSPNPKFRQNGRTTYPEHQGCIAKGWQNGWHFDANFPEDKQDHRTYCLSQYAIPNTIHNKMRMRSRVYAVKRLDDALGASLGVIVIEGLEPTRFDEQTLLNDLNGSVDDYSQLIRTLKEYIPNPNDAAARGL